MEIKDLKQRAAERAVEGVESGMVVGLGSGSTAAFAVHRLAELLHTGDLRDIRGVPTSTEVEELMQRLAIPLTTLNERPVIDLTIDGADEVDEDLNLIKGGGGALLREKIVAQASLREIIVVDETKLSQTLGMVWPLPVEVIPFGWHPQERYLQSLGARTVLRRREDGRPFETDEGNFILDCDFGAISDVDELAARLSERAGIVEHGLFIRLASEVIVGTEESTRRLTREG